MIRFIMRARRKDPVSGYEGERLYTFDTEVPALEAELGAGGYGESGYECNDLIGVEVITVPPQVSEPAVMNDKTPPWAALEKQRGVLLNHLGALVHSSDVVALANVRDAIDHLIMERLEYSGKPTITESFVLKAIEELRVVELEIGVPSKALQLLGCSQINGGAEHG